MALAAPIHVSFCYYISLRFSQFIVLLLLSAFEKNGKAEASDI